MKKAVLFTVLVVVVVLVIVGYVWYLVSGGPAPKDFTEAVPGGAKITRVDLTASDPGTKLPPGFPEGVPVEQTITESLRRVYEEYGIVQYAVNSVSDRSFETIWQEYVSFFDSAGYVVKTSDKDNQVMEGIRGDNELTIYILPRDSKSFVTLYYVEKN
ncbi:MAG: hypothetical protein V2A55_02285 [Candidatus Jorgensenbacteria bacterium]